MLSCLSIPDIYLSVASFIASLSSFILLFIQDFLSPACNSDRKRRENRFMILWGEDEDEDLSFILFDAASWSASRDDHDRRVIHIQWERERDWGMSGEICDSFKVGLRSKSLRLEASSFFSKGMMPNFLSKLRYYIVNAWRATADCSVKSKYSSHWESWTWKV